MVPAGCCPDASRSAAQVALKRGKVTGLARRVSASWFPSTVKHTGCPVGVALQDVCVDGCRATVRTVGPCLVRGVRVRRGWVVGS